MRRKQNARWYAHGVWICVNKIFMSPANFTPTGAFFPGTWIAWSVGRWERKFYSTSIPSSGPAVESCWADRLIVCKTRHVLVLCSSTVRTGLPAPMRISTRCVTRYAGAVRCCPGGRVHKRSSLELEHVTRCYRKLLRNRLKENQKKKTNNGKHFDSNNNAHSVVQNSILSNSWEGEPRKSSTKPVSIPMLKFDRNANRLNHKPVWGTLVATPPPSPVLVGIFTLPEFYPWQRRLLMVMVLRRRATYWMASTEKKRTTIYVFYEPVVHEQSLIAGSIYVLG